jgi:hypothetical protein
VQLRKQTVPLVPPTKSVQLAHGKWRTGQRLPLTVEARNVGAAGCHACRLTIYAASPAIPLAKVAKQPRS